ncbi:hypothetical protein [Pseudomonas sp. CLCA07]
MILLKLYRDHEEVIDRHLKSICIEDAESVKAIAESRKDDCFFSLAAGLKLHLSGRCEGADIIHKSAKSLGWNFYALNLLKGFSGQSPSAEMSAALIKELMARFNYREAAKYLIDMSEVLAGSVERLRSEICKRLLECGDDDYIKRLGWSYDASESKRDHQYIQMHYDNVWYGKIRSEISEGRGLKLLGLAFQCMSLDPKNETALKILRYKNYSIRYFLYGRRVAYFENPSDSEILLALVECLCVYRHHDEAYSILKPCITGHLVYSAAPNKIKQSLYYIFLKLEDTFEKSSRKLPLISSLLAKHSGLFECYGFDILGLASRSCWEGRFKDYEEFKRELSIDFGDSKYSVLDVLSSVESIVNKKHNRSQSVATLVSGQIRGLDAVSESIKKASFYSDVIMTTWDVEGVMSTQLFDISRIFPRSNFETIPTELASKDEFSKYFPSTIRKIDELAPGIKSVATHESISNSYRFKLVDIESDSDFGLSISGESHLKAKGLFNQAKMFYKISRAFSLVKNESYDVLIRRRSDLKIDINGSVLDYCLAECRKNRNVIYVPYHTVYGCNDQFAIGSCSAMQVYSSIWERIRDKGLRYSELFHELSVEGAELLVANHLYVHGITVKIIPTLENGLSSSRVAAEVIDVSKELHADYEALDENGKSIFKPFIDSFA